MGLFRKAQRSATAIAVGETRLLVINRDSLYHLMQQRPRIATTLFLNLARQLRQAILRTSQRVLDQVSKTQQEEAPPTSQPRPLMLNIFQGMTTKEQESLRGFGVLRSLPQGEKIMNQGEQGKEVLILLQGQLKVQINKDKGYVVLALINPGNLVGETAWLEENLVRTADVVAGTDSLGLFYDRLALEKLVLTESSSSSVCLQSDPLLADRLEAANEQLEQQQQELESNSHTQILLRTILTISTSKFFPISPEMKELLATNAVARSQPSISRVISQGVVSSDLGNHLFTLCSSTQKRTSKGLQPAPQFQEDRWMGHQLNHWP